MLKTLSDINIELTHACDRLLIQISHCMTEFLSLLGVCMDHPEIDNLHYNFNNCV